MSARRGVVLVRKAALAGVVLCALLAAACGGPETVATGEDGEGTAPGGTEAATSGGGAEGEYWTVASHDELVAAAEAEGSLIGNTSLEEETIEVVASTFSEKYPNIELTLNEQSGSEAERILLEVQAGTADYDLLHLNQETYTEHLPYLEKVDLLAMAEAGTIDVPVEMINPDEPNTMASSSGIAGFAYNPTKLPEELIPESWEDFLRPELAGRQFLVDIEPTNFTALTPAMGEDWVRQYAEDLRAQDPIWARGETNALTAMAAGEYQLHFASNYHSAVRASERSPDTVAVGLIEPIPVKLASVNAIRLDAANPHAALLMLEHMASPEVQQALDELEPLSSSIYAEGSELNEVTEGKELSVLSWDDFEKQADWFSVIAEAWGFPTAEVEEEG